MERDVHLVGSAAIFEIVGYLVWNVDIAVGCGALGLGVSIGAKRFNIDKHIVALLDVGVEKITLIGRLGKFLVFT